MNPGYLVGCGLIGCLSFSVIAYTLDVVSPPWLQGFGFLVGLVLALLTSKKRNP